MTAAHKNRLQQTTGQIEEQFHGAIQNVDEAITKNPMTATLATFTLGIISGVVIGAAMSGGRSHRSRYDQFSDQIDHLSESLHAAVPDAVSKYFAKSRR